MIVATHPSTWKKAEARIAAFFGARRAVLSGNRSGRDDREPSDSTHPRLHIEAKLREKHSVYRVWDAAVRAERRVRVVRTPVVVLQEKKRPGFLVCVHSDDFGLVAGEWLAAQDDQAVLEFEARVRIIRQGLEAEIAGAQQTS